MARNLVPISRAEIALKGATFATLHPEAHAFRVTDFADGVREQLDRMAKMESEKKNGRVLRRLAMNGLRLGTHTVHIMPVNRNLVRHGWACEEIMRRLSPDVLALPTGETAAYNAILGDGTLHEHCRKRFDNFPDFTRSEREVLKHCVTVKHLTEVVDRRLLTRVREGNPQWNCGLRNRKKWSYADEHILHYPFFKAAWSRSRTTPLLWCGIPPWLFEERARNKCLAAEWQRAVLLENELAFREENAASTADWFSEVAAAKKEILTPQEIVSDLNMRHVVLSLKRLAGKKKILLIVPAFEYHLVVGWVAASSSLTTTSLAESVDTSLDIVPSFTKARKTPEFHSVERSVHVDTDPSTAMSEEEHALTQDRRLAGAFGGHNPHISATLRPSAGVRVLDVNPSRPGYFHETELTKESRNGFRMTPDDVV